MAGPSAFIAVGSPVACCTWRPTGQLVRSMCKGGVAKASFASERMTVSWLNAHVVVNRMASERMLAHFISGPQVHTTNANTVLLPVFESKGGRDTGYFPPGGLNPWRSHCGSGATAATSRGTLPDCMGLMMA